MNKIFFKSVTILVILLTFTGCNTIAKYTGQQHETWKVRTYSNSSMIKDLIQKGMITKDTRLNAISSIAKSDDKVYLLEAYGTFNILRGINARNTQDATMKFASKLALKNNFKGFNIILPHDLREANLNSYSEFKEQCYANPVSGRTHNCGAFLSDTGGNNGSKGVIALQLSNSKANGTYFDARETLLIINQ